MEKKATIDVDPKTAEMIAAVAKKTGMDESSVIEKMMNLQLADKPQDPMREKLQRMRSAVGGGEGGGKSMADKYLDLLGVDTIKSAFGKGGKENSESKSLLSREMLAGILEMKIAMSALGPLLDQPRQQESSGMNFKDFMEFQAMTSKPEGAGQLDKFMEYQRHQDELRRRDDEKRSQEMMNVLEKAITGKRIDEIEEKVEQREDKLREDQQRQLEYLQSMEARLAANQQPVGGFSDEMLKYSTIRNSLLDFAKSEGMTKEVIDPSGKIKWESVLQEFIGAARDIGTAHAQKPPQPQEVIEMTPEEYAAYQAGQPITQTPTRPQADTPPEFAVEEPPPEPPVETQEIKFSPTGTVVEEPKKKGKKN